MLLILAHDQVHQKLASSDLYETELLEQFADTDAAKEFFALLDLQLNKVNQFYKGKEAEFLERGDSLEKQMQILVELKTALKQQHPKGSSSKEDDSISGTISCGIALNPVEFCELQMYACKSNLEIIIHLGA